MLPTCDALSVLIGPHSKLLVLQDTKLSNAAAWGNLGADEEDGQKANDDEEDNADGLWNNFQSRDDVERVEV